MKSLKGVARSVCSTGMNRMHHIAALAVVLLLLTPPAEGIVRRHDRDDARYLEYGARFKAVARIGGPPPNPEGTGTLIAPQWVLTAGHVGDGISMRTPLPDVEFLDRRYEIEAIHVHPCFRGAHPAHDLALISLRQPVADVTPIAVYRDSAEVGRVATLVGSGFSGTGLTGPRREFWDHRKRAATNRIEGVEAFWISFTFDPPATATDLEGFPGAGDSGGPDLIEVDGTFYVAGVESGSGDSNHNGVTGDYGDRVRHTRVSSELRWIDATMAGRQVAVQCYDQLRGVKRVASIVLAAVGGLALGLWFWRSQLSGAPAGY